MAFCLFVVLLVLDQAVKSYVSSVMLLGETVPIIDGIFHITYILNPGAAFGMLAHQRWFFILAGITIIIAFLHYYPWLKQQCSWFRFGCVALLSGAVGNLVDRIRIGMVVDFFDFRIWPVFNIADIAIVLGVASMIYAILFKMKDTED